MPRIELWYGPRQRFGHAGQSQRWVNILGRVQEPDTISILRYTLNGGKPRPLSIGADKRRLAGKGDFNIDLDRRELNVGSNEIIITAIAQDGQHHQETVNLTYSDAKASLPFSVNWADVTHIQDVSHVADGLWALTPNGISPQEIGYDRTLTFGDMHWRDYRVTVPITVHAINAGCYDRPSVHAGVGVVMRWKGHTRWGSDQWASGQPCFGPSPYGAIGWYCVFHDDGPILNFFDPDLLRPVQRSFEFALHTPYVLQVQVTTLSDTRSRYMLKAWPQNETEPQDWLLETVIEDSGYTEGAVLLVAHHTACTFGNVQIDPLTYSHD